jgi:hypothetical protein
MANSLELLGGIGIEVAPARREPARLLTIVEQVEREARRMRLDIVGYPFWRDQGHTDARGMTIIAAHIARREGRDILPFVTDYVIGIELQALHLLAGLDITRPDVMDIFRPLLPDDEQE